MNFKEKIQAVVDNCVLVENDIGFRCRGTRGSAWATLRNVTVYETTRVFRLEYRVRNIKSFHMAFGQGVVDRITEIEGGAGEGFLFEGERTAPPLPSWPYRKLLVGDVIPPGDPPASADSAIPTRLATGWEGNPR
jgi:hypothetical protein